MEITKHFYKSSENYKAPEDLVFFDIGENETVSVHGLYGSVARDGFCRLPRAVAEATNPRVASLYTNPSGGRVRFKTNSTRMAVRAKYPNLTPRSILTAQASMGFDIFVSEGGAPTLHSVPYPPIDMTAKGYEKCVTLGEGTHEVEIYLPLYNDLASLAIGLDGGATLEAPTPYAERAPILFYGSSITQGASASRAGNAYPAMLERRFHTDFLNLGFASGALGEAAIAEYMASLSFSVFVCDYDYNAPSAEHLAKTHWPLYEKIRASHPKTPILLITKPILLAAADNEENDRRRAIIRQTYERARASGDQSVYLLDGKALFAPYEAGVGCADGVHPNDLGMWVMAEGVGNILKNELGWREYTK